MKYRILFSMLTIGLVAILLLTIGCTESSSPNVEATGEDLPEATAVSVSVVDEVIEIGEQTTINIIVDPSKAIAGMQFDLSFDPTLVNIDSVEEGDLLNQDGASTFFNAGTVDNDSGVIEDVYGAIASSGKSVSTKGTFAVVKLTAKTKEAECLFTLSNVIVGDIAGNSISLNILNGDLNIGQT
jgi:hypothetical protein